MKKHRVKIILIIAAVFLSLYFLYPTYQSYRYSEKLASLHGPDSLSYYDSHEKEIRDARMKRIKLGLDLQGGMRVVLEVDVVKLLDNLAKNKDDVFNAIMAEIRQKAATSDQPLFDIVRAAFESRGVRLSRYYGSLRDSDSDILSQLEKDAMSAVDRGMEIIRNRVDQYGVSEPSIAKQGGRRIVVELPGVSKESEVRQLLQGTALLEFKLVKDYDVTAKVYEAIDAYLAKHGSDTTSAGIDTTAIAAATDTTKPAVDSAFAAVQDTAAKGHPWLNLVRPQQIGAMLVGIVSDDNRPRVNRILARPDIQRLIPNDMEFLWSAKPNQRIIGEGKKWFELFAVRKQAELTGGVVTDARATIDPNTNGPIVLMSMSSEGAREWSRITGANVHKHVAIVLDNAIFSAPEVRGKITGGSSQIEGMDNIEEARLLEIVLKAGALPAPVTIIEQRTVGPSLGEDSIRKGLTAAVVAFIVIVLFMITYYRTGGAAADFALLFNILWILGVLAGFGATLTLPGIAGIVLTIGMAVDANVLIYERIREELGTGKTLRAAIDPGYAKAFPAIFDSNITTFFSGVVLYEFGTGPIQGFALTLMIGIVASMFSAIIITRVLFDVMLERGASTINYG